jgi:hypothetical protein
MPSIINAQPGTVLLPTAIVKTADATGNLALQTNSITGLTIDTAQNITANSTGSFTIPVGNTAQRPASPVSGMLRYNTTLSKLEIYINDTWTSFP